MIKPSLQQELHLFAQELHRQLSRDILEDLARKTGFVQRASKYQANELVALCVWISQNLASTSLTKLCSQPEASTGVSMSPEGINQRWNKGAVDFLRQLFARLMNAHLFSSSSLPI